MVFKRQTHGKHPKRASLLSQRTGFAEKRFSRMSIIRDALVLEEYKDVDPTKFQIKQLSFSGQYGVETKGQISQVQNSSIQNAIAMFKENPEKFLALMFPTEMLGWPEKEQQYILVHRAGTTGFQPRGISKKGKWTLMLQEYQPLPPLAPKSEFKDKYTDTVLNQFNGAWLTTAIPGRGMGLLDEPNIKVIGDCDLDPSSIKQGQVGDCWLLSGIAAMAEFDGAIQNLFRKTPSLEQMPFEDGRPNIYTITLWDLPTWKEVDIVVDERLCLQDDPNEPDAWSKLQGAKPSEDGELWVCYLEKALAAHCGGWDHIDGGYCTHAWSLLTGNKEQYLIQRSKQAAGKYICLAKYNMDKNEWSPHANAPLAGNQQQWQTPWPSIGGDGDDMKQLDADELFQRLCAWDDENFLIACATENAAGGYAGNDNHAYSVLEVRNDVAGSGIDMVQVRNPWGKSGTDKGSFVGINGPGWRQYPQIKKLLNPVDANDGLFWVTKSEFFKFYPVIYLSAFNMTTFFKRANRTRNKPAVNPPTRTTAHPTPEPPSPKPLKRPAASVMPRTQPKPWKPLTTNNVSSPSVMKTPQAPPKPLRANNVSSPAMINKPAPSKPLTNQQPVGRSMKTRTIHHDNGSVETITEITETMEDGTTRSSSSSKFSSVSTPSTTTVKTQQVPSKPLTKTAPAVVAKTRSEASKPVKKSGGLNLRGPCELNMPGSEVKVQSRGRSPVKNPFKRTPAGKVKPKTYSLSPPPPVAGRRGVPPQPQQHAPTRSLSPATRTTPATGKKQQLVNILDTDAMGKVTATFSNTGRDDSFAGADLYFKNFRWASLGKGDPPVAVETFPGHRWFIVANGIYAKQFDIGDDEQQYFAF